MPLPVEPARHVVPLRTRIASGPARRWLSSVVLSLLAASLPSWAVTHKCGDVAPGETWIAADGPFVLDCEVHVPIGVTLTIQPMAIVKAAAPTSYGLRVDGTLLADGALGTIVFTSLQDDSAGGDTNNNGPSSGTAGDWGGLYFSRDSVGSLNNVEVRYGGGNLWGVAEYSANVTAATRALTVTDSLFTYSYSAAVFLTAYASQGASFRSTTARNNPVNGLVVSSNYAFEPMDPPGAWNSSLPYVLSSTVTVPAGVTLKVAAKTVVKPVLNSYGYGLRVDGTLIADGTTGRILFTSLADDTAGNDTNNDGSSSGTAGDWGGLYFSRGSAGNLNNIEVRYGGGNYWSIAEYGANVTADTRALTVTDSLFTYSSSAAVFLTAYASQGASISSTGAEHNPINGLVVSSNYAFEPMDPPGAWNSSLPYVLSGTVTVPAGVTLKVAAKTVVKPILNSYGYGLRVDGTLLADGALGTIVFTSLQDDSAGGDTNNNGPSSGTAGDWGGLYFSRGSAGNLNNIEVRYGGGNYWSIAEYGANVTADTRALTVTDSLFTYSSSAAVFLTAYASQGASISSTGAEHNPINGLVVSSTHTFEPMDPPGAWNSSLPYVLSGTVTVPAGVTLKVAAKTVVKPVLSSYGYGLRIEGTLIADGTAGRILFTSLADDTAGGDTNNNGPSSGTAGDWGGLFFSRGSAGNLNNVEVRYGGGNYWGVAEYAANVTAATRALTVTDSLFTYSYSAAVFLTAYASQGASFRSTTARNNPVNGLAVSSTYAFEPMDPPGEWNSSLPYVLSGTVTVPTGVTLKVAAKTVVKPALSSYGYGLRIEGTLIADGTTGRIYFTALADDTAGNDTNNDGPSSGTAGDWGGLYFSSSSGGNSLNNVEIRYGGGNSWGLSGDAYSDIASESPSLSIVNSTLTHSKVHGLWVSGAGAAADVSAVRFLLEEDGISFNNGSSGNVTRSAFVALGDGINIDSTSRPTLGLQANAQDPLKQGFNTFVCNRGRHLCSLNPVPPQIPAVNNWWGSDPPDPDKFCGADNLDLQSPLSAETAPVEGSPAPALTELRVTRGANPATLHLTWEDIAPGPNPECGYDVFRATMFRPAPDFTCISGAAGLQSAVFDDPVGAGPEDPHYYSVYVHWKCP